MSYRFGGKIVATWKCVTWKHGIWKRLLGRWQINKSYKRLSSFSGGQAILFYALCDSYTCLIFGNRFSGSLAITTRVPYLAWGVQQMYFTMELHLIYRQIDMSDRPRLDRRYYIYNVIDHQRTNAPLKSIIGLFSGPIKARCN